MRFYQQVSMAYALLYFKAGASRGVEPPDHKNDRNSFISSAFGDSLRTGHDLQFKRFSS
jgi:hypothetical protein